MTWEKTPSKVMTDFYTIYLKRPRPKLPLSYFWTWDHSAQAGRLLDGGVEI